MGEAVVVLSIEKKTLDLGVGWGGVGAVCAEFGRACVRHDFSAKRRWRHLYAMGFETQIVARTPRSFCRDHGVLQINLPWAVKYSRFTLAFEAFAIQVLLTSRNVKAAYKLLKINWDGARAIMERALEHGPSYVSVMVDLKESELRVLEVGEGKKKEDAVELLKKLPEANSEKVKAVAMDMSAACQAAAAVIPKADLFLDRFHISKLLGEAMDQVRRVGHKKLTQKGDNLLDHYNWLYHPDEWSEIATDSKRDQMLEDLAISNRRTARAYYNRILFLEFCQQANSGDAQRFFMQWYHEALRSGLPPIKKVAETFRIISTASSITSSTVLRMPRPKRSIGPLKPSNLLSAVSVPSKTREPLSSFSCVGSGSTDYNSGRASFD